MRIIICLSIIVFEAIHSFGQPSAADKTVKPPSQKEMQAQLRQVKTEAQAQISSLEKDIAAAKANNEDPESIKQMESQLATLRQVLGGVDKVNTSNRKLQTTLPPPTTTEPKYVSPFEPIVLKQPITPPAKELSKDQLFWYKGKKVDANTLVTTNKTIVRYNQASNRLVIQTAKPVDTTYYGLLGTLSQTTQIRNDFVIGVSSRLNSFFMYPQIQEAYDDFISFRERYYDIGKNSIQLPAAPQPLDVLHRELLSKMAALPRIQNAPAAPERPNDLCDCNSSVRKQYEIDLPQWFEAFCHDENGLLYLLEAIYLDIHTSGQGGNAATSNIPNLKTDIVKAFDLVLERLTQKLEDLTRKYQSANVAIEDGLVLIATYLNKLNFHTYADIEEPSTRQLKTSAHAAFENVKMLVIGNTVFEKYIEDQKAAKNFNAVFDYTLYVSHEMNKKALDRPNNVWKNVSQWLDKLDKFNRFELSMKLDFEYVVGDNDDVRMDATGQLESHIELVELGKNDCGWQLNLKYPDHTDRSGNEEPFQIPFRVVGGTKFIKNVGTFGYTGPARMNMIYPVFKLDFCPNGSSDSVFVEGLRFSDADLAAHSHDNFAKVYTTDLFQYVNKMFITALGVRDNSASIVSNAFQAMDLEAGTRPPSTGNPTLDKLMMEYLLYQKKSKMLQNATSTTHTGNTVIPFNAQNGQSVIISTTYSVVDPADKDNTAKIGMKSANITITVTHSPL